MRFYLYSVDPLIFSETFIHDIHFIGFDLKDKVIVDVGAFVGDTALYYANFGGIVYAYEPHPVNFYWLKKNIACNIALIEFFIDNIKPEEFKGKRVLEVGSRYVNGSVRPLIENFCSPKEM